MFEQTFKNIDDILYKDADADSELDDTKLGYLLVLKYNAIGDAKKELGYIPVIINTFIGFQTYLYDKRAAI